MRAKWIGVLLLIILLFPFNAYSQEEDISEIDLYQDFGNNPSLIFLKGITEKIQEARNSRNAKALCAFSSLLFYAENIAEKKHSKVYGMKILGEAMLIAWTEEDVDSLRAVQEVFRSKIFGPGDLSANEEIEKKIQSITEKKPKRTITSSSAQAYLMAEEAAKSDAVQQLAERIYGVMIESLTEVKNFKVQKDVVVATLKSSLLLGVRYKTLESEKDIIKVSASVPQDLVIKAIQVSSKNQGTNLTDYDVSKLKKKFYEKDYTAIGRGPIK